MIVIVRKLRLFLLKYGKPIDGLVDDAHKKVETHPKKTPRKTETIRAISEQFSNTAYGFFLGKRVAYPVVANYVRNTWGKYKLVKSMLNLSTRIFSFHFSSIDGLDAVLEIGPWFIRNNPLILKKRNPDVNLLKEDMGNVPVWVKLHGVHVTAFSEDGLSVIATKLGTPFMLDSYTSDMCILQKLIPSKINSFNINSFKNSFSALKDAHVRCIRVKHKRSTKLDV
nr:hypothetical protein [Tanacetum cinerariifolium]